MRSYRTAFVVGAAFAALSWSGISRADDTSHHHMDKNKGSSTQTQGQPQGQSGSGTLGGTTDPNVPNPSGTVSDVPSPASPTSPATGTSSGTIYGPGSYGAGTGSGMGSGMGSSTTTDPSTITGTTTTTAAPYTATTMQTPPPGAEHESFRPNRPLLATGAGIFLGSYGASVIAGAASNTAADDNLFIPVAGPWMDLSERQCGLFDCSGREDLNHALLIGSGVAQGVGVGLAIASLIIPEKKERLPVTARARSEQASKARIQVTPINVRGGGGFGAVGTF